MEGISSNIILQNIRDLRQERKYSQEYMAHRLTFSQNAYSKLERGLTKLTLERLAQIAGILNTTVEDLLRESARGWTQPEAKDPNQRKNRTRRRSAVRARHKRNGQ